MATPLIGTTNFNDLTAELSEMAGTVAPNQTIPMSREKLDAMIQHHGVGKAGESAQSIRSRVLTGIHRVGPRAGMTKTMPDGTVVDVYPNLPHTIPFRLVVVSAARGDYALHRITAYANYMPSKTGEEQDRAMERYKREIRSLRSNVNVDVETKQKLIGHEAAIKMLDRQQKAAHAALAVAMETGADAVAALAADYAAKAAAAEVSTEIARERRLLTS